MCAMDGQSTVRHPVHVAYMTVVMRVEQRAVSLTLTRVCWSILYVMLCDRIMLNNTLAKKNNSVIIDHYSRE